MAVETGRFCFSLKSRWISGAVPMKLCDPVAFKTFHLTLFPMDIWFISLHPSKIFHPHTTPMTSIARLTHRRTLREPMPSKETPSSRSLPKDMAAPARRMTLETGLIDGGFDRRPSIPCSLAHHGVGSPKCGMQTRSKGLKNLLMAGSAKALPLCGSCPFPFMSHLLSACLIIPTMTFHTTQFSVSGLQERRLHIGHLIRFPDPGKRRSSGLSFFFWRFGKLRDERLHPIFVRMATQTLIHILFCMKAVFD
jgi:hypothetical protein